MADYYEILGVARSASAAEVRAAYMRLARERHPDRFTNLEEKQQAQEFFKEATAAFNTLSSLKGRREYDESLERPRVTTPEEIARDAFVRGVQQFEAKSYQDAIELFRAAVHHAPSEGRYHAALGRALAKNPHWVREAIQEAEQAVQLEPARPEFHACLAELYNAQGLKLRARRALEAARALAPAHPEVARVGRLVEEDGA
jgi:DnaJ-class molecular chaperone